MKSALIIIGFVGILAAQQPANQGKDATAKGNQDSKPNAAPEKKAVKPAAPAIFPPYLDCIPSLVSELAGKLSQDAKEADFKVAINYQNVELDGSPVIDHTTGIFLVKVKAIMRSGNGVQLTVGSAHAARTVGACDPAALHIPVAAPSTGDSKTGQSSGTVQTVASTPASTPAPAPATPPPPAPPKPAQPQLFPTSLMAPQDGAKCVSGEVKDATATKVDLFINGSTTPSGSPATMDAKTGAFQICLKDSKTFVVNQSVVAKPDSGAPSDAVQVTAIAPPDVTTPHAGDKTLAVTVHADDAKISGVSVNGQNMAGFSADPVTGDKGKFTIKLPDVPVLNAKDIVIVSPSTGPPSAPVIVATAQGLPTDVAAPHAGDKEINVTVHAEGVTTITVSVDGQTVKGTTTTPVSGQDKFKVGPLNALQAGKSVVATPDKGVPSVPVTVAAEVTDTPQVATLKEGEKTVSGSAPAGADHLVVVVKDYKGAFVEQSRVEPDTNSHTFTAGLSRMLAEDDTVEVRSQTTAGTTVTDGKSTSTRVETNEYNWGRVRAYFSLGAVTAKDDDNFQKVRPYISLNVDKNWITSVHCYPPLDPSKETNLVLKKTLEEEAEKEGERYAYYRKAHEDWRWRCDQHPLTDRRFYILFNTYFEARLQNANSLSISQLNATNLKTGDRVGYYEFGAYLPFNTVRSSWRFDGQRYALFVAPILKGGMETIPTHSDSTSSGLLDTRSNFKFFSGGLRIGQYRAFANSHSVAPELISWMDFTFGRWDRMLKTQNPPKTVPLRFEVTGRLKIPYSPFTIGVTSNTGPGTDEFSLFAGMRFDLSKVLAKVAPQIK